MDCDTSHSSSPPAGVASTPAVDSINAVDQGAARADELLTALVASLRPTQDERLLLHLAAHEMPIIAQLERMQLKLAQVLEDSLHDPRLALSLAKTFREISYLSGAAQRRVREALDTAATLRARRRFLGGDGV